MLVSVWKLTEQLGSVSLSSDNIDMGVSLIDVFHGFTPMFVLFLVARFVGGLGGS